jgi:transposase InsO family protein
MARGFVYLVAVIDWFSRRVLSWRISNSRTADFCVEALEEAISRHGAPEIFNTDQGSLAHVSDRRSCSGKPLIVRVIASGTASAPGPANAGPFFMRG